MESVFSPFIKAPTVEYVCLMEILLALLFAVYLPFMAMVIGSMSIAALKLGRFVTTGNQSRLDFAVHIVEKLYPEPILAYVFLILPPLGFLAIYEILLYKSGLHVFPFLVIGFIASLVAVFCLNAFCAKVKRIHFHHKLLPQLKGEAATLTQEQIDKDVATSDFAVWFGVTALSLVSYIVLGTMDTVLMREHWATAGSSIIRFCTSPGVVAHMSYFFVLVVVMGCTATAMASENEKEKDHIRKIALFTLFSLPLFGFWQLLSVPEASYKIQQAVFGACGIIFAGLAMVLLSWKRDCGCKSLGLALLCLFLMSAFDGTRIAHSTHVALKLHLEKVAEKKKEAPHHEHKGEHSGSAHADDKAQTSKEATEHKEESKK